MIAVPIKLYVKKGRTGTHREGLEAAALRAEAAGHAVDNEDRQG